jgi:hypothetical protein
MALAGEDETPPPGIPIRTTFFQTNAGQAVGNWFSGQCKRYQPACKVIQGRFPPKIVCGLFGDFM